MTWNRTRDGSMILFAMALVAVASMAAFALASSMRSARTSARDLMAGGLAESAARAGVRHVHEVVLADYAAYFANPSGAPRVTSPVGPHYLHFADTRIRDRLWGFNFQTDYFRRDPSDNQVDNLPIDGSLLLPIGQNGAYAMPYRPWGNTGHETQILATGAARYIEPGRWRRDGGTVLFSEGLDPAKAITASPGQPAQSPVWYDKDWVVTNDPMQVRYRLRYAVNAVDLGGTLLWGEQKPWADPSGFSDRTLAAAMQDSLANPSLANPWIGATSDGNPFEWDMHLARSANPSFFRMVHAGHLGHAWVPQNWPSFTNAFNTIRQGRVQAQFLGWGSGPLSLQDPALLMGFQANGRPNQDRTDYPGMQSPTLLPLTGGANQIIRAASMNGGPASWQVVQNFNDWDSSWVPTLRLVTTPFGRAASIRNADRGPDADLALRYYGSRVRTPWRINALTAPASVHKMMIMGYLPPVIQRYYSAGSKYQETGAGAPAAPNNWRQDLFPGGNPQETVFGANLQSSRSIRIPAAGEANPSYQPFLAYGTPDYTSSSWQPTASYTGTYPDAAEFWEDYGEVETRCRTLTSTGGTGTNADPRQYTSATQVPQIFRNHLLGWHIDTFDQRRNDLTQGTANPTAGAGKLGWLNGWHTSSGTVVDGTSIRPFGGSVPMEPLRGMSGDMLRTMMANSVGLAKDTAEGTGTFLSGQHFFHADSYWLDLAAAMANAVVVAKSLYLDSTAVGADFATAVAGAHDPAVGPPPAGSPLLMRPDSVKQLDRLFLAALGEHFFQDYNLPTTDPTFSTPAKGIVARRLSLYDKGNTTKSAIEARLGANAGLSPGIDQVQGGLARRATWFGVELQHMQASANIRGMQARLGTWPNGPMITDAVRIRRKQANMELVLNDMRMSFFGGNPDYTPRPIATPNPDQDEFRPFDFDGDGFAVSSCYATRLTLPGIPSGDRQYHASAAPNGYGRTPDVYFSLTGYYVMEKARFWRVIARGEVWDELLRRPVADATMESAFAIDPEGSMWTKLMNPSRNEPFLTRFEAPTLYQRWITNLDRGSRPLTE